MSASLSMQDVVNEVSFDDLCRTIRTAIDSDRIGEPVNVRLHWEFPAGTRSLKDAAETAVAIADTALALNAPEFRVRHAAARGLLHLLCEDSRGRSALITLAEVPTPRFAMTVYGNHGVARIEESVLSPPERKFLTEPPSWLQSLWDLEQFQSRFTAEQ